MRIPPEFLPVVQITLPVVAAIWGASWIQNKRLDDIVARIGKIEDRLLKIEERLTNLETRVTRLEERIPPLVHH
jgi:hypothetical protein